MRIMGLDFGSKTVGVAISDPLGLTAQGIEIVRRKSPNKLRQTLARIGALVKEYQIEEIVLGYPKNMNNTEGERCERTKEFKELLEKRCRRKVTLWDERLTTVEADRTMMEAGIRRENRRQYVDQLAALFCRDIWICLQENERKTMEKIEFQVPDSDETVSFYVMEQTRFNGMNYLLVTEEADGDCDAFLLKEISKEDEAEASYEMVESEEELEYMSKIFASVLEDVDITV